MGWMDDFPEEQKREYERVAPALLAFQAHAAPTLFKWIEWSAVLAIVRYAHIQTGAWPLLALQVIAYLLLWGHLAYFFSDRSTKWKPEKEFKAGTVAWLLGLLATTGVFSASLWLVRVFVDHPL